VNGADRSDAARAMFSELADLPADDPRRVEVRDRLVATYLGVARGIARKFRDRGEPVADLEQVAVIGLIKAIERFDVSRGISFLSYAIPTMTGEVRRYFRDHGWAVHVPRGLVEMHQRIGQASRELTQQLGSAPTPSQLAKHLGVSVDDVLEGLEVGDSYRATSLDVHFDDDDSSPIVRKLGGDDPALELVEQRQLLRPLLAGLKPREQRIVIMRFFENRTQSEIAERVGLSQMHVSRLLTRSLARMREQMTRPAPPARQND
jgi:RNA polymerase sigma-B factor